MFSEKSIEIDDVVFDCTYDTDSEDYIHFDSVKVGGICIVEHLKTTSLDKLAEGIQASIKADNDFMGYPNDSIPAQRGRGW